MKPKALVVLALWGCGGAPLLASATRPEVQGLLARVPLHFERNDGQADPQVRFLARGSAYGLYLTADEAVLALQKHGSHPEIVRWRLVGANPSASVAGEDLLPGKANYLLGDDPSRWLKDVPLYARVRYADVYPGISLTYYGDQRRLEYDLELAPEADPRAIRFRIDGAKSIRLDDLGRLRIRTPGGELVQQAPVVYQMKDGERQPVAARFRRLGKREIGFTVASYDHSRTLVIDPKIEFETYLGGDVADEAADVVLGGTDNNLEVYIVGTTASTNFRPTLSPSSNGGRPRAGNDIFVIKLLYTPGTLVASYATYLGGNGDDRGVAIALENDGTVVVAAQTNSADIYQTKTFGPLGGIDAWVAELNTGGSFINYAVKMGGDKTDIPRGVAVDGARNVFLVGLTQSGNFPLTPVSVPPPILGSLKGAQDGFFSVIVGAGTSMTYSTYIGGGGDQDEAAGVALSAGETYIVGTTDSADFFIKNAVQPTIGGGSGGVKDAFVMDFSPSGTSRDVSTSTYFGGKLNDSGKGIATDDVGDVYIVGETESEDFPVLSPYQDRLAGSFDAFVAKFKRGAQTLLSSTYLGGSAFDSGEDVAVNALHYIYVTGTTQSDDFPVWRPLDPPNDKLQPPSDAFLTRFVPPACTIDYSTFIGGKTTDEGAALALTPSGSAVVVGRTDSGDLQQIVPVSGTGPMGGLDAFATLVSDGEPPPDVQVTKAAAPATAIVGGNLTYTVAITNLSALRPAYDIHLQDDLPLASAISVVSVIPPAPVCNVTGQQIVCDFSCLDPLQQITVTIDVTVLPAAFPSIGNRATITVPEDPFSPNDTITLVTPVSNPADIQVTKVNQTPPDRNVGQTIDYLVTVTNNGPGSASNIVMTDTLPPGTTFVSVNPLCPPPVGGVLTCNITSLAASSSVPFVVTVLATTAGTITNHATVSATEDIVPGNNSASAQTNVLVPGGAVKFFTVRSTNGENLLEWQSPSGAMANIVIHRTTATGDCSYQTDPAASSPLHVEPSPTANAYDTYVDNAVTNNTTYCYSIFVDLDGSGTNYSPGRFNRGRPFDSLSGKIRWEFNIGTSSLAPVGNGAGIVHSVANDANLYAMVKDVAGPGASGGGRWPPGYLPYPISGPSQGRPGSIPLFPPSPAHVTFLSSDDGRVYAIDSDHGNNGSLLWTSSVLGSGGTILTAPPSGSFIQFGATRDLIYVGSRDTAGSQLYGLNLSDGQSTPPGWALDGAPFGSVGPVSGQAAVDYGTKRVYFASRAFGAAPNNRTVWCVDFETGVVLWAQAHGNIDAGVSLRGNHLYVATNDGRVLALDTANGNVAWTFTVPGGEGVAKGYVAVDNFTTNLYFSTFTRVWALRDDGTSFTPLWPGGVQLPGGISNNSPSVPVLVPGDLHLWVGGSDSRLHRLNVSNGSSFDSLFLGTPAIVTAVGSPTIDLAGGFVYVGTEAGRVYAIQP